MAKAKAATASSLGGLAAFVRFWWRPQNRSLALCGCMVFLFVGAMVYGWRRWGQPAMQAPDYFVTAETMEVSPQPKWIRADVRAEVIRAAGITRLDLRDRQLLDKVSRAFALHPWVAKVLRVRKRFPAQVHVELQYRRPSAVVEVAVNGHSELLFVDEESVLLPSADFQPEQAKDYLRIAGNGETTASVFGMAWGSRRIAGAVRLAALWTNRWQPLELYRIVAVERPGEPLTYELRTKKDVKVLWGSLETTSAEPAPAEKIAALEQLVRANGSLDRKGGPATIDLIELAKNPLRTAGAKTAPR